MGIFEMVNEVAVLGTTFFMIAVSTIWYSEYLFRDKWLKSAGLTETDIDNTGHHFKISIVVTFLSYLISVLLLAVLIGYAQVLDLSVQKITTVLTIGFASLLTGLTIWEKKSFMYYLITIGFSSVFIIGSSSLLYYWPW